MQFHHKTSHRVQITRTGICGKRVVVFVTVHMVICHINSNRMLNSSMVLPVPVATQTEVSTRCNSNIHKTSKMMKRRTQLATNCKATRQHPPLEPQALASPTRIKEEIGEVIGSRISSLAVVQTAAKTLQLGDRIGKITIDKVGKRLRMLQVEVEEALR